MTDDLTAYTSGPICLDVLPTVMGQYRTDYTWNGWLVPAIDAHAVVTVLDALAHDYGEDVLSWEWVGEDLHLTEYDGEDAYLEVLAPDEDGLYSLGAGSWVWSEDVTA